MSGRRPRKSIINVDRDHGPDLFNGKRPDISFASAIVQILVLRAADPLSCFVQANSTMVMLVLGFRLLTGMTLIAKGCGVRVPKDCIYAAVEFSVLVEALNKLSRGLKGDVRKAD